MRCSTASSRPTPTRRTDALRPAASTAWAPPSSRCCGPATRSSSRTSATPGRSSCATASSPRSPRTTPSCRTSSTRVGSPPTRRRPTRSAPSSPGCSPVRADDEPDLVVRQGRIGDRYLIASDGLTDYVARDTVEEVLTTTADPGECADRLVALALRAGAPDNVTVVVGDLVDIARTDGAAHPARRSSVPRPRASEAPARSPRRPPRRPPRSPGRPARPRGRRRPRRATTGSPSPRRGPAPARGTVLRLARAARRARPSSSPGARTPRTRGPSSSTTSPPTTASSPCSAGVDQTLGPSSLSQPRLLDDDRRRGPPALVPGAASSAASASTTASAADARVDDLRLQAAGLPLGPGHGEACRTVPSRGPRRSRRRRARPHRHVRPTPTSRRPPSTRLASPLRHRRQQLAGVLMSVVSSPTPRKGRNVELVLAHRRGRHRRAGLRQRRASPRAPPARPSLLRRVRLPRHGRRFPPRPALAGVLRRPADAADHDPAQRARTRHDPPTRPRQRQVHRRRAWPCASSSGPRSPSPSRPSSSSLLRDHRILRRYTYLAGGDRLRPARCCRCCPVIGTSIYGSRIWIQLGPFSFQPGEIAKICARDLLRRLPRADARRAVGGRAQGARASPCRAARDLGPILSPGSRASRSSSSSATSAPRCSSSACSSRCSTSRPSGCRGSSSAWACSASAPTRHT